MKDIVITEKNIKREILVFLLCFVASYGCNIYSIIKYDRPLTELYSTIGFVITFAVVLYIVLWIFRLLFMLLKYGYTKLLTNKK